MSYVLTRKLAAWVPFRFLFQCRACSVYWPLTFLIFSPPRKNFYALFLTKFVFFVCLFLSLALALFLLSASAWSKKRLARLSFVLFCFFPLKVRNMDVYHQETVHRQVACRLDLYKPFPSSFGPLFQNEGRCSAFDMEIIFHSHANETNLCT